MADDKTSPFVDAKTIASLPEHTNVHQFNNNGIRHSKSLGDLTGLTDIGVHQVRLEQGRESTQFHYHHCDEEFIYIISGSGIAEIGDKEYVVSAGDFMGFAKNALPHSMRNENAEDLVYLMAGSRNDIDICDYPRINRRMYREHGKKTYLQLDQLKTIPETKQPTEEK